MARRDVEKALGEIREAVNGSAARLTETHKDQADLRRKVLETVQQGTAGLREENRELRRRQERMLTDLADTRTGVEALRREVAQAFAHIVGAPLPSDRADHGATFELVQHTPHSLEAAGSNGWGDIAVNEATDPAHNDDQEEPQSRPPLQDDALKAVTEPASRTPAPVPLEPAGDSPADPVNNTKEKLEQDRQEDRDHHTQSVLRAAGIASAKVICHRDTWSFLIEQTSQHSHFRLPERINDLEDGMIETFLSGRSALAVLVTMRKVRDATVKSEEDMATWALASAIYRRTQLAVTDTTHTRPDGAQVTTITLDDRPQATSEAA
ncbi:hypothetical protein ACFWFU_24455 [Streptomyces sp. NPDC060235]|uniref:hypothetical protein n=1 Tax=Streptomyces sp. NPDC060235 TaxID=3347080 RepID=UPI0036623D33